MELGLLIVTNVSETENKMSLFIFHILSKFQRNVSEGLIRLVSVFVLCRCLRLSFLWRGQLAVLTTRAPDPYTEIPNLARSYTGGAARWR